MIDKINRFYLLTKSPNKNLICCVSCKSRAILSDNKIAWFCRPT